jgi:PAS domain S-box-containing protein
MPLDTHVLIVEDGPDDREYYQRLLTTVTEAQYVVTVASTGADALKILGRSRFDCVILDYGLPGIDGLALLKQFRRSDPFLPIIMLTGQARDDIAAGALKAGANDYVEKGRIGRASLHRAIQQAISACRQAREAENQSVRPLLLIDDNADDREAYRRLLKATSLRGQDVIEAPTGEIGLQYLADNEFEAVVLDYALPGMNGLAVLKRIRILRPHIPVILLTGNGNISIAVEALQSGANDYLVKSAIDADSLYRAISASIAKSAIAIKDAEILAKTTALAESEERYRLLALNLQAVNERAVLATEAGGVGIWEWDIATDQITWDARMFQLYGMLPDSQPVTYAFWTNHLHPNDRVATERAIRATVDDNRRFDAEFRIVWDDGTIHHIRANGQGRQHPDGRTVGVVGTNWDVTEQRLEAEQRAAIIEAAPNGMMIVDEAGYITLANSQIERMFGYSLRALIGQPIEVLVPDAQVIRHAIVRSAFTSGQNKAPLSPDRQVPGRRCDGSEIMIEIMLSPVATPRGRIVVASLVDVTEKMRKFTEARQAEARERVRMEESNASLDRLARQLAHARDQAEQANRAKTRFLASITHEIRTPLHGVLGQAEMLSLEGGLTPRQAERLEVMTAAGQHLLGMINTVLDMSQIEADQVILKPVMTDLSDLIGSCLEVVRPTAERKGLTLTCKSDLRVRLLADATRLRQVLLNLLGNAVKFTSTGSVSVRLSATPAWVRVEVADTGAGIPQIHRDKLFKTFERLDEEATHDIEGHGLGLAIAARLLALMNGRIGHDPNPAGGSVFWLELPRADDVETVNEEAPTAASVPQELRVLVVDDEPLNRDIAQGFLTRAGHQVTCADGGAAAITAVANTMFDVVLMDVRMPGVNGLDATRAIRRLPTPNSKVPIIAVTAQAFAQQIEMCQQAGMNGHVTKPFTPAMLLQKIEQITRASQWPGRDGPAADGVPDPALFDPAKFEEIAALLSLGQALKYLQTLQEQCDIVESALRTPDKQASVPEPVLAAAHTLAGCAATLGFRGVGDVARTFEYAASGNTADTPGLAVSLLGAITAARPLIRSQIEATARRVSAAG